MIRGKIEAWRILLWIRIIVKLDTRDCQGGTSWLVTVTSLIPQGRRGVGGVVWVVNHVCHLAVLFFFENPIKYVLKKINKVTRATMPALLISIDAEKAFDRVHWP